MANLYKTNAMPSIDAIRQHLSYDPGSGVVTWVSGRKIGKPAGYIFRKKNRAPCWYIYVLGKNIIMARAIWAIVKGEWPCHDIDHINVDSMDNRWENLRACTRHQGLSNKKVQKRTKSGMKGVYFNSRTPKKATSKRYHSKIQVNGKTRRLGQFHTAEEAHAAFMRASEDIRGEFARG